MASVARVIDASLDRLDAVTDTPILDENGEDFTPEHFDIELKNIFLCIWEEDVLKNISIEIPEKDYLCNRRSLRLRQDNIGQPDCAFLGCARG